MQDIAIASLHACMNTNCMIKIYAVLISLIVMLANTPGRWLVTSCLGLLGLAVYNHWTPFRIESLTDYSSILVFTGASYYEVFSYIKTCEV